MTTQYDVDVLLVRTATSWSTRHRRSIGTKALRLVSPDDGLDSAVFDENTDRWRVKTTSGEVHEPRILVAGDMEGPCTTDTVMGLSHQSLAEAWKNGPATYLGIAVTGFPNFFVLNGTGQGAERHLSMPLKHRIRYIARCIALLNKYSATRIEVKPHAQEQFCRDVEHGLLVERLIRRRYRRASHRPEPGDFEFTTVEDREPTHTYYMGPVVVAVDEGDVTVSVTLTGLFSPLDGNFHWYGRIASNDAVHEKMKPGTGLVWLRIADRTPVPAKLGHADVWNRIRVTGIGQPPYSTIEERTLK